MGTAEAHPAIQGKGAWPGPAGERVFSLDPAQPHDGWGGGLTPWEKGDMPWLQPGQEGKGMAHLYGEKKGCELISNLMPKGEAAWPSPMVRRGHSLTPLQPCGRKGA